MKVYNYSLFLFATILMAGAPSSSISPQQIAQNNNAFAFDLYNEIILKEKGNVFFSPFSISTALAMTYAGADSSTATEMQNAMHFGNNTSSFHSSYGAYLKALDENATGNIKWRVANRLWGDADYVFNDDYVYLIETAYNSPLEKVNFVSAPEWSRQEINNWVADKTEDRIKNLIPEGAITTDTRLVLTNAIYFKGDWLYKFNKKMTKEKKFYLADGNSMKTPFMHCEGAFHVTQTENYKMIRLPYKGEKQSMILVLPNKAEDLAAVEAAMNTSLFAPLFEEYLPPVELALPKFKLTIPLGLNAPLQNLGIKTAFTSQANFSKMTPSNNLMISDVLHKAFIEINEEGTEAAAATAVVMVLTSTNQPEIKPFEFKADHPFLFYIIDDETKAILFMGRLIEPVLN
jgi:serpin B